VKFEIHKDDRTGLMKFEGSFDTRDIPDLPLHPWARRFVDSILWEDSTEDILRALAVMFEAHERKQTEEQPK
jgi:hypothetical protein